VLHLESPAAEFVGDPLTGSVFFESQFRVRMDTVRQLQERSFVPSNPVLDSSFRSDGTRCHESVDTVAGAV
jgi:hypothetical protein